MLVFKKIKDFYMKINYEYRTSAKLLFFSSIIFLAASSLIVLDHAKGFFANLRNNYILKKSAENQGFMSVEEMFKLKSEGFDTKKDFLQNKKYEEK